jgi:hypothetical protein
MRISSESASKSHFKLHPGISRQFLHPFRTSARPCWGTCREHGHLPHHVAIVSRECSIPIQNENVGHKSACKEVRSMAECVICVQTTEPSHKQGHTTSPHEEALGLPCFSKESRRMWGKPLETNMREIEVLGVAPRRSSLPCL